MNPAVRFCKNCRWYRPPLTFAVPDAALCTHPSVAERDLVHGRPVLCMHEREDRGTPSGHRCGTIARHFEPKPQPPVKHKFWQKVFG